MSDERRIYVNGFAGKYRCQFDFISGGGSLKGALRGVGDVPYNVCVFKVTIK